MKKKILTMLLVLTMVGGTLAGCSNSESASDPSIPATGEITTEVASEETTNVNVDDSEKESKNPEESRVDSEVLDRAYNAEDIAMAIDPEHFGMSISAEGLTMSVANSEGNQMMSYSVFVPADKLQGAINDGSLTGEYNMETITANGGIEFECSIYQVDGQAYCYANMTGTDEYYKIVDPESETTQSFFADMPESEDMTLDVDTISNVEYIETIIYNELPVDVVRVTGSGDVTANTAETFDMYIDPETGRAVAMVMPEADEAGNDMIINLSVSTVELPEGFENCGECTSQMAGEYMIGIMMFPILFTEAQPN